MDAQPLATEDSFENETFTDLDLQGANLDPTNNRVKATHVPVETAVLLAQSLGMRVSGFTGDAVEGRGRKKGTR